MLPILCTSALAILTISCLGNARRVQSNSLMNADELGVLANLLLVAQPALGQMRGMRERIDRRAAHQTMEIPETPTRRDMIRVGSTLLGLNAALSNTPQVHAGDARTIGEVQTSGLVFKDTLKVEAFDDPKVAGVKIFLSDFQRPVAEKVAKGNIFNDPSQGGLTCSHSGKVVVSTAASRDKSGEEVFREARSLVFKSLKVRRFIDEESKNIVYAVYSERLNKDDDTNNSRFKSNLCAVPIDEFEQKAAQ